MWLFHCKSGAQNLRLPLKPAERLVPSGTGISVLSRGEGDVSCGHGSLLRAARSRDGVVPTRPNAERPCISSRARSLAAVVVRMLLRSLLFPGTANQRAAAGGAERLLCGEAIRSAQDFGDFTPFLGLKSKCPIVPASSAKEKPI